VAEQDVLFGIEHAELSARDVEKYIVRSTLTQRKQKC
jgi:hypothetical protein